MQTRGARLDSLTGLRFLAAYIVLVHHFTVWAPIPQLAPYSGFGPSGVTFFFVLSGFVLAWSAPPEDTPGRFYWRRFARIWPLHAVTTIAALPVFYAMRDVDWSWSPIALSVVLLHAWAPRTAVHFGGNPASWSLSCEAFFYALFPGLNRLARRLAPRPLAWAAGGVAVTMAVVALVSRHEIGATRSFWLLYVSPVYRVGEFILGVLLATAMSRGWVPRVRLWQALGLVVVYVSFLYDLAPALPAVPQHAAATLTYAATPVVYAILIAATARLDITGASTVLRSRPLLKLGQWSYALYLTHATIIYAALEVFGRLSPSRSNVWLLVGFTTVAVAVSAACYEWIEHPVERRLRRQRAENIVGRLTTRVRRDRRGVGAAPAVVSHDDRVGDAGDVRLELHHPAAIASNRQAEREGESHGDTAARGCGAGDDVDYPIRPAGSVSRGWLPRLDSNQ